jgi:hypothetical protein
MGSWIPGEDGYLLYAQLRSLGHMPVFDECPGEAFRHKVEFTCRVFHKKRLGFGPTKFDALLKSLEFTGEDECRVCRRLYELFRVWR